MQLALRIRLTHLIIGGYPVAERRFRRRYARTCFRRMVACVSGTAVFQRPTCTEHHSYCRGRKPSPMPGEAVAWRKGAPDRLRACCSPLGQSVPASSVYAAVTGSHAAGT